VTTRDLTFRVQFAEETKEMASLRALLEHAYLWMADNPAAETVYVERVVDGVVDLRIGLPGIASWAAVFDHTPVASRGDSGAAGK
jgi:hypothetical protein